MANTFVKIASTAIGSGGSASVTFSSIPATYTDLCILVSSRNSSAGAVSDMYMTFNGSATSYSERTIFGNGSTTSAEQFTSQTVIPRAGYSTGTAFTTGAFSNSTYYITNYASSLYKSVNINSTTEDNGTGSYIGEMAGLWSSSSAITSLTLTPYAGVGNFAQYSTFTLYGIKNS